MSLASLLLVVCLSAAAGFVVGTIFGFSITSHFDVLRGVRPTTDNAFIRFLARPTRELRAYEVFLFLLLMLLWLVVFFALVLFPGVVADRLSGDGPPLVPVAYVVFLGLSWLGRRFGAHAWRALT